MEDNLFEKPSDHSRVTGWASKAFHPFGHIIYGDQDIFVPPGGRKRANVIYTPNVKYFNLKNVVKGHFIPP